MCAIYGDSQTGKFNVSGFEQDGCTTNSMKKSPGDTNAIVTVTEERWMDRGWLFIIRTTTDYARMHAAAADPTGARPQQHDLLLEAAQRCLIIVVVVMHHRRVAFWL